jgi:hypothetical protein
LQAGALTGGYADLEYTYVVDTDGAAYMSRGPAHNTAATGGETAGQSNNSRSHAICCMGNFEHDLPTDAMLDTVAALVADLFAGGWQRQAYIDGPHQDAPGNATACCGRNLIARIDDLNRMAAGGPSPVEPEPEQEGGAMQIVEHPSGRGYWIVDTAGAVFAYGAAKYHGGANTLNDGRGPNAPIVSMAATPSGNGYWLLGADGGVFAYGDAAYYGAPTGSVH